jgi:3-oxoacyl-[acyl-carrier protein] reductase
MARTIVITGGSRGIGRHVAQRFAVVGDDVVITGRSTDRVQQAATEMGVRGIACDATDPSAIARFVQHVGPSVDVLVNMAGGNTDLLSSGTDSESLDALAARWHDNLAANLLSAVLTTAALRDRLQAGATVINIGSIGAEYAATSYGAAKAALAAWSAGVSAQLAPTDVTVNVVAPGYIAGTDFFHGQLTDERQTRLIEATHNKRAGEADDVVGIIEFLASPQARHITGQTIHVNGGAHTTR